MDVFEATAASLWASDFDHENKIALRSPDDEHALALHRQYSEAC
jgi:hypothetical protein